MKIFIANDSQQSLGGGFRFIDNFIEGITNLNKKDVSFAPQMAGCDIVFIPSVTMIRPETYAMAKNLGKKIVVRLDNIPKKSRNKRSRLNTRMPMYCQDADLLIYQSRWAHDYVSHFVKADTPYEIIINGVDTSIFNSHGERYESDKNVYLYSSFSDDPSKQYHKALAYFHYIWRNDPNSELWLAGKFPHELIDAGFDFFDGERVKYYGVVESPYEMAKINRGANFFLYTYFNDACSNTVLEAMECGVTPIWIETTGCANEISKLKKVPSIADMASKYLKAFNKLL